MKSLAAATTSARPTQAYGEKTLPCAVQFQYQMHESLQLEIIAVIESLEQLKESAEN